MSLSKIPIFQNVSQPNICHPNAYQPNSLFAKMSVGKMFFDQMSSSLTTAIQVPISQ
jgi:hypothetical protein